MGDGAMNGVAQPLPLRQAQYLNRPARNPTSPIDPTAGASDAETQRLKEACDSFEALFTQQMLKQMRATVPKDGMFGGGSAEQIYTEMLDAELSKEMTATGGMGISRLLFEHMQAARQTRSDPK